MSLKLNVIGIAVSNMAASLAFYRRLGLAISAGSDTEPHVEVELDGGLKLLFDTDEVIASFDADYEPTTGPGRGSLAFEAGSPAEVDEVYGDLLGAGHHGHLAPFDAVWGQRYAVMRDPDGNTVDLYAALPG